MEPDKIKKDEKTEIEISRVPSQDTEEHDEANQTESLQQKSERDRNQGNETIGIP